MRAWSRTCWFGLWLSLSGALACGSRTKASHPPRSGDTQREQGLWCTYVYDGVPKRLPVSPTTAPYRVPIVDVEQSFGMRWVYSMVAPEDRRRKLQGSEAGCDGKQADCTGGVSSDAEVSARLAVYVYDLRAEAPLLLHESKYEAPFVARGHSGFTGRQFAYASDGEELEYYCGVEAP